MYFEILDQKRQKLYVDLSHNLDIGFYYMAGGTALNLQMGFRKSVGFDFFVPHTYDTALLFDKLSSMGYNIKLINQNQGTLDVLMNDIQVSFFYFSNPLINNCKVYKNMNLASKEDIAIMKLIAIGNRGAKKDFFDLYHLLKETDIDENTLIEGLLFKYRNHINYFHILLGLNYFRDANHDVLPDVLIEYDWEEIKAFFNQFQSIIIDAYNKKLENERANELNISL